MGRKRLQQKGNLYNQGGWWKLRWQEEQRKADGTVSRGWSKPVWIGLSTGPGRMTKTEARRVAWDNYLSRLDQNMRTPQAVMTVAEFVERKFIPEHVTMLKPAGRTHYEQMLDHVLEGIPEKRRVFAGRKMVDGKWGDDEAEIPRHQGIGKLRLRDVGQEEAQRLVSEAIRRGYSVQTARHIKNVVSAIFTHAKQKGWHSGDNPATFVNLPEMERRQVHALSLEQLKALLALLNPMPRAMVLCASMTSMNIAEVCGLRWKRVNLTPDFTVVDGESLPGFHAAVREQWFQRQWGSVKSAARRRNVPMVSILVEALAVLKSEATVRTGDEPVFLGRAGRPVDQQAMLNRQVRKAAADIGVPAIGWHDLRRTFATLADQIGMSLGERQAIMGHSRSAQTMAYTHTPTGQAATVLEKMAQQLGGSEAGKGTVQ